MKRIFPILIIFLTGCFFYNRNYLQTDKRFGSSEIINYEYSNKYLSKQILKEHFLLNIEIDQPAIIELPYENIENIYPVSNIEGDAFVYFKIDSKGKVMDYRFIKRAGLGYDKYIISLIRTIKIRPVSHRGIYGSSEILARFIIKPQKEL